MFRALAARPSLSHGEGIRSMIGRSNGCYPWFGSLHADIGRKSKTISWEYQTRAKPTRSRAKKKKERKKCIRSDRGRYYRFIPLATCFDRTVSLIKSEEMAFRVQAMAVESHTDSSRCGYSDILAGNK